MSQAEVFRLADRTSEAETALQEAIRAAEQKQNLVASRHAREVLQTLLDRTPH
jgi:hypothetical protein